MRDTRPTDHWNTPRWLCEALSRALGSVLDPCSNPHSLVVSEATADGNDFDGLSVHWSSHLYTYANPPYSNPLPWARKMAHEVRAGARVAMLVKLDPTTEWWREVTLGSAGHFLFHKRLRYGGGGIERAGARFPSALIVSDREMARLIYDQISDRADWHEKRKP